MKIIAVLLIFSGNFFMGCTPKEESAVGNKGQEEKLLPENKRSNKGIGKHDRAQEPGGLEQLREAPDDSVAAIPSTNPGIGGIKEPPKTVNILPTAPNNPVQNPPPPTTPNNPAQALNLSAICADIGAAQAQLNPLERHKLPNASDVQAEFLSAHNKIRSSYGLPLLVWDNQIADYAQAWANYLKDNNDCKMQHRSNAGKQEGKKYGENLAYNWIGTTFLPGEFSGSPASATINWSDECKDYSYDNNDCKPGEQCGHFTQVVWKTSTKVGCGVAVCRSGASQSEIWVCNYDPPGNMTLISNGVPNKLKPF